MTSDQNIVTERPALLMQHPEDLPGDLALWIFIFAEMLAFGVLFVAYAFDRAHHLALYNLCQQSLDKSSGLINTLVLITSSYAVVKAIEAIKVDRHQSCACWLMGACGLGCVFVCIKFAELMAKAEAGITLSTNSFYMFYLSLSFFHLMHVLMGIFILAAIAMKARRRGYSARSYVGVETGASFWHMVDFLWIILFPLVYIMH